MTRRLDLGPMLAIAAAAIAGVAIIAGFIIVGGPGNARDQRLDDIVKWRVSTVVGVAQCAFDSSALAPLSFDAAKRTRPAPNQPGVGASTCGEAALVDLNFRVAEGDRPALGEISYSAQSPNHVRICAHYRTASDLRTPEAVGYGQPSYPQLSERHPAGIHCYEIDLVKSYFPDTAPQAAPLQLPPQ